MKKWMMIPVLAGAIGLGGVTMIANADKNVEEQLVTKDILTVNEVEKKVLEAVGGQIIEIEYEKSEGKYEVEIVSNGAEYDLEVNAKTGKITYDDKDDDAYKTIQTEKTLAVVESDDDDDMDERKSKATSQYITADEAVAVAMKSAKGKVTDLELDEDDGRAYYDIEIEDGVYEYEFEIDAMTGKVLEFEKDRDDD